MYNGIYTKINNNVLDVLMNGLGLVLIASRVFVSVVVNGLCVCSSCASHQSLLPPSNSHTLQPEPVLHFREHGHVPDGDVPPSGDDTDAARPLAKWPPTSTSQHQACVMQATPRQGTKYIMCCAQKVSHPLKLLVISSEKPGDF